MMYIIWKYQLPDHGQYQLMMEWNFRDPPDEGEKMRNVDVQILQGNPIPYIDMWI